METLGDIPFLGKLSRIGLGVLSDISQGNGLKGLNQKRWLLGVRVLSADYGPSSLLGHFGVRTPTRFCHLRKLTPLAGSLAGDTVRAASGWATSASSGALSVSKLVSRMAGG